jgi:hypothetical protein
MATRSSLVYLSCAVLAVAFLMLSCAWSSHPDELRVRDPGHFQGMVHVDTCVSGAPAQDITLDAKGMGKTSLCPAAGHTVEIDLIEQGRHYKIAANQVHIQRAGDGMTTSIEVKLPVS